MKRGGTIRKVKNGKFQWVGYYTDSFGKVHRPVKTFETEEEAEEYRRIQQKNGSHVINARDNTDFTVAEYYEHWQKATSWSTEKYYHFTTTNNWRSVYAKHILPFIGNELLQDIDYTRLQQHFNEAELSRKTYRNILQALKAMLTFAKAENKNLVIVDNFKDVGIVAANAPRVKVFNVLNRSDVERILRFMEEHEPYYCNLISFLLETGLRIEEALALKKENIDYEKRHISVVSAIKRQTKYDNDRDAVGAKTKLVESMFLKSSSACRAVPLTAAAEKAIAKQIEMLHEKKIKSKYLFCSHNGKPTDARNVLRAFHAAIDGTNREWPEVPPIEKKGLHSLRKLYCKHLKDEAGFEWEEIKTILGHSDVNVTIQYYYSYNPDDMPKYAKRLDDVDQDLADGDNLEKHIADLKEAEVKKKLVDVMYDKLFGEDKTALSDDDLFSKAMLLLLAEEKGKK